MKEIMMLLGIALMLALSGCAVHFGVDWNGETAKDFRTFSQKDKK